MKRKFITHKIFRIQDHECIMRGFMLVVKTLLDYTNLISRNDYKMSDKIIYKYFKERLRQKKKVWRLYYK